MAEFPTDFVEQAHELTPELDERGNEALRSLNDEGIIIISGVTDYLAGVMSGLGQQDHIREYCPKDAETRFPDLPATRSWIQKGDVVPGRAAFFLLSPTKSESKRVDGYAWTGYEEDEDIPEHPVTSAYRLSATGVGRNLSKRFTQVVVSATKARHAPELGIGLETWESNHARGMYEAVGFVQASMGATELRPTLDPAAVDGKVEDRRVKMIYPEELFAA